MADDDPDPPTPPPISPAAPAPAARGGASSPAAIWAARLAKELVLLQQQQQQQQQEGPLVGVTKLAEAPGEVDLEEGLCTLRFQLQREEDAASEQAAAAAAGVVTIVVEVELGQQSTNYPFEPPVLRVLSGREHLPRANVSTDKDDGAAAGVVVVLPALAQWTPNTGLLDLLAALQEALGRGGQEEAEGESGGMTEAFEPGQALHTSKFKGPVFPCVVRQQGGGVLHRYVGVSDEWLLSLEADRTRMEWVAVVRAQPMLTVAKLKYRRGESITIIFKDNSKWELQMAASAECVAAIQAVLAEKGVQGRKTSQAALNQIERARALIQEARRREREAGDGTSEQEPLSMACVQGVMDLYRDAIELLSSVSDEKRHTTEVVALLHAFLQRSDVVLALEQAPPPPPPTPPSSTRSGVSGGGGGGGLTTRLQQATQRGVLQAMALKGEVLPRSDSEVHSQEDDGLAREERNLLRHGLGQLNKMMDLGLGPAQAGEEDAGRVRASSQGSGGGGGLDLSTSGGSAASGSEAAETEACVDASLSSSLEDLEGLLAQATAEFEKLSSPEKRALAEQAAAEEDAEAALAAGGRDAAAAEEEQEAAAAAGGEGGKQRAKEEEAVVIQNT